MSSAQPLLSAAVRQLSPMASRVVVKVEQVKGFQVFRIDGYSWTKTLAAGERISSGRFDIGGRGWCIDYYPNGAGRTSDSDSVSLYLRRLAVAAGYRQRVRAQYKFSLLDSSGNAAYELPAETAVFTASADDRPRWPRILNLLRRTGDKTEDRDIGAGLPGFVAQEELERRREILLSDDCLAIRCDVAVTEVIVAPKDDGESATTPTVLRPRTSEK
ncbi:BTB/POZ and MATH domain-containing protein 5-like [Panicum virgatum]|uniref:MATH domain-containing protein n=1 Tax=Panicum virgatum TaxID=38727 RepID=A0A8T0R7B7_PANVG|nr:BTB/POZ and MATH domain-containing protein 5-like [Panicum virgatum]KAG2581652.1 hypothetical protein PVAP13_6KG067800 [Panicum virgatum]